MAEWWYIAPGGVAPPEVPCAVGQHRVFALLQQGELALRWARKRSIVQCIGDELAGHEDFLIVGFASQAELRAFHGGLGGEQPLLEMGRSRTASDTGATGHD